MENTNFMSIRITKWYLVVCVALIHLTCIISKEVYSQTVNLLINATSSTITDESNGRSIVVDGSGNMYVTGEFSGSVSFGNITLVSLGESDIFIAKYNNSGICQWAKRAGGTSNDRGLGIALSGSSIYITGFFRGIANFNSPFTLGSNEVVSEGNDDIFIAKYDDSGIFQWARRAGGAIYDAGYSIVASGSSVYITGVFRDTASFSSAFASNNNKIISIGDQDIFIAKYDDSGIFQWARRAGGVDFSTSYGITVSNNSVYITGGFIGTANFNTPFASGSNEIMSVNNYDIFIAKYDETGIFQWARRAGGAIGNSSIGNGRSIAAIGTSIYVTGEFQGTINFNTPSVAGSNEIISVGGSDIFIAKYDETGAFQWVRRAGGTSLESSYGIAASGNSVYITGIFYCTANFNTPSTLGINEITSESCSQDVFVAKYNDVGTFQWAKRAGGIFGDFGNAVAVSNNSVYIIGSFDDTANFNTPSDMSENTVLSVSFDAFIARYGDPVLSVELLSFNAIPSASGNLLTWQIANEINNKGFEIQRLENNLNWSVLGFIDTQSKTTTYDFIDNTPLSVSYYRLRQIDNDSKETFSKVISVASRLNTKLNIYPNPVSNNLTVETGNTDDVQIFNLLGQRVLNTANSSKLIDLSGLPLGTYFLKIGTEQVKFVKQ